MKIKEMTLAWDSLGLQFVSVTTTCVMSCVSQTILTGNNPQFPPLLNQENSSVILSQCYGEKQSAASQGLDT